MTKARGFKKARSRARKRPGVLDDQVVMGITETVTAVHTSGRANIAMMVKRRSGALNRLYRKTVRPAKKEGLVGYISKTARKKAFYARFIHDGTKHIQARPFHDLAVAEEEGAHSRRMKKALRHTVHGGAVK